MPLQEGLVRSIGTNLVKGYFVNKIAGDVEGPIAVTSSNVASIAYNFEKKTLMVNFLRRAGSHSPTSYVYFDVPTTLWDEFKRAPSKGKFMHTYIISRYKYDYL